MKKPLVGLIIILTGILIYSCSDSGTGPDPGNNNEGGNEQETPTYNVSVDVTPSDAGSISPSANGTYNEGEEIELQANPSEEYVFSSWSGDVDSTSENPFSLTVDQDYSLKANFELKKLTLTVDVAGQGSVTRDPNESEYTYGTNVELSATAENGWVFDYWDVDLNSEENPVTVTIDSSITLTAVFANKNFAGGNGSEKYPYQISTLDQLQSMNNDLAAHYIQINDIDASPTMSWNSGLGFKPIGSDDLGFIGSYDGAEYTISGLYINRESDNNIGLFMYSKNTVIKNTKIINADITGRSLVGGLIGSADDSQIKNSHVSGKIVGSRYVGGVAGYIDQGQVSNSSASTDVTGDEHVGGLIGAINYGNIDGSYAEGKVTGPNNVGGLIGTNSTGSEIRKSYAETDVSGGALIGGLVGDNETSALIFASYASGNVTGSISDNRALGGLVGQNYGEINKSYANGEISGKNSLGGLVGINFEYISNSYATGNVNGETKIGGLSGWNYGGQITTSYASGQVIGTEDIGGLIGLNGASLESSYWNIESTGQNNGVGRGSSGGTGLTTSEMTGASAETNMTDFDWVDIWVTTNSYPVLYWE